MNDGDNEQEGKPGVGRVEAFSDGVIAIIITIMVLELHAPEEPGLEHLMRLWPVASAYVLSFAYVGIYWVNHHRLFSHARVVTNSLLWLNLGLLFWLSLMPFSAAYLGEQNFNRSGTLVYLATLSMASLSYVPLQREIHRTGARSTAAATYHRQTTRKGIVATILYLLGFALTFVAPWFGILCAAIVAVLWFVPESPFDALFDGRGGQH